MPDGGTLTLRTQSTTEASTSVNRNENLNVENSRYISLEVQDTGYGMSKETQQNLFAPDYTTKTHGTGLGMAIVRRIITVHGGELTVESEENVGSTIRISFNEATYRNDLTPVMIPNQNEATNQEVI